jgi:hypothetical protein
VPDEMHDRQALQEESPWIEKMTQPKHG